MSTLAALTARIPVFGAGPEASSDLCVSSQHDAALRAILAVSSCELFAAYHVPCEVAGAPPVETSGLCGILGFTGDTLRGCVVVTATDRAVSASNPLQDGATRDWIAELTNQLVGRFKNALLRRGVDLAMSIPVVLQAHRLVPVPQRASEPVTLLVGGGGLQLWLETTYAPSFVLAEPAPLAAPSTDYDPLLF